MSPLTSVTAAATPVRIAFDGRTLTARYPGVGRYAFNLLRALPDAASRRGWDAEITVLAGEEDPRFPRGRIEGVRWETVDASLRGLRGQLALPPRLRRLGAAVFHAPYFVTAYRVPCPLVVTVHDAIGVEPEYLPSAFARLAFRVANHLALRSARAVITVSEASKRDLVRCFAVPAERVTVIPEAPAAEFRPAPDDAVAELRVRLSLPPRYALFVGTPRPHKNLEGLVRAWSELEDREVVLVVVGREDPRFPEARRTAEQLGVDVRFLGEVPDADLPALYSGAEMVVVPSFREGFGLPVVEAMACGTPVACSDASSLPEVAAGAAALFDPRSTASMVEVLTRLRRDAEYRRQLTTRGRVRAARLTWDEAAERTLEVYGRAKSVI